VTSIKTQAISKIAAFGIGVTLACLGHANEGEPTISELWTSESLFTQPESAAFDPKSRSIFVSNVNGYAKDGNGFVSRISESGQVIDLKWLDGLNSPTGLTVHGDVIYVVDYDEVLKVDLEHGTVIQRYPAPHEKPALNDVVVTKAGEIFVTGSASAAIYKLEQDNLVTWKQDDQLLKHANGLYEVDGTLLVGGSQWLGFDIESGDHLDIHDDKLVEIDGIASDGCQGFILTLIDDERLWHLGADGQSNPLSEAPIDGIDLSFHDGTLFVPRVGGRVSALKLGEGHCR
jgi:hypothetical protein